jgi:hypothetical protein
MKPSSASLDVSLPANAALTPPRARNPPWLAGSRDQSAAIAAGTASTSTALS